MTTYHFIHTYRENNGTEGVRQILIGVSVREGDSIATKIINIESLCKESEQFNLDKIAQAIFVGIKEPHEDMIQRYVREMETGNPLRIRAALPHSYLTFNFRPIELTELEGTLTEQVEELYKEMVEPHYTN